MTIPHISTAHIHEITLFLQQTDNMQWCCNFRWSWSQNWVSIWLHYSVCNLKKRKLAINNKKKSARNFDCKLYMNKMRGKFMWQGWVITMHKKLLQLLVAVNIKESVFRDSVHIWHEPALTVCTASKAEIFFLNTTESSKKLPKNWKKKKRNDFLLLHNMSSSYWPEETAIVWRNLSARLRCFQDRFALTKLSPAVDEDRPQSFPTNDDSQLPTLNSLENSTSPVSEVSPHKFFYHHLATFGVVHRPWLWIRQAAGSSLKVTSYIKKKS